MQSCGRQAEREMERDGEQMWEGERARGTAAPSDACANASAGEVKLRGSREACAPLLLLLLPQTLARERGHAVAAAAAAGAASFSEGERSCV